MNSHNTIAYLRKLGAIIETRREHVTDVDGTLHRNVGHYVYKGWKAEEVPNEISKI
jgi:hypothetical protein